MNISLDGKSNVLAPSYQPYKTMRTEGAISSKDLSWFHPEVSEINPKRWTLYLAKTDFWTCRD